MDEPQTLAALFGDEDDIDLEALSTLVEGGADGHLTDNEIEAFMREQWGLPALDAEQAIKTIEAGRAAPRPSDEDSDDFSEEEWTIVQTLRRYCQDAISPATKPAKLKKSVEWIFVRDTQEPKHGVSFHLACQMLRSRHWVIQALIQHFWFIRGILVEPLPFMADELPEAIEQESIIYGWDTGREIARIVWNQPGILEPAARKQVAADPDEFTRGLSALLEAGIIGSRMGCLHVSARPASFRRSGQGVSWSNSFVGE